MVVVEGSFRMCFLFPIHHRGCFRHISSRYGRILAQWSRWLGFLPDVFLLHSGLVYSKQRRRRRARTQARRVIQTSDSYYGDIVNHSNHRPALTLPQRVGRVLLVIGGEIVIYLQRTFVKRGIVWSEIRSHPFGSVLELASAD